MISSGIPTISNEMYVHHVVQMTGYYPIRDAYVFGEQWIMYVRNCKKAMADAKDKLRQVMQTDTSTPDKHGTFTKARRMLF
jgi:hypothetical protein